jgi:hypothetical protein
MNGNVYAPDFGFGRNASAADLSPLEVAALPIAVKAFHENLTVSQLKAAISK